jgi:undecaprenyl-diphosphatase
MVAEAEAPRPVAHWRRRLASATAASGVVVFSLIGWLVSAGHTAETDLMVTSGLQQARNPLFSDLMVLVSQPGFSPFNIVLVLGVIGMFWLAGQRVESAFAGLAAVGVFAGSGALKQLWLRPRPADESVLVLGSAPGYSFPSGHTLFYVGFFGFLFYWAYTFLNKGPVRTALLWLFGLLIVLVGPSRVYLGHHWTSDVLAGYALGLTYLFVLIRAHGAARFGTGRARRS